MSFLALHVQSNRAGVCVHSDTYRHEHLPFIPTFRPKQQCDKGCTGVAHLQKPNEDSGSYVAGSVQTQINENPNVHSEGDYVYSRLHGSVCVCV